MLPVLATRLRRSTRLMGSDNDVLLQPATDKDVDMSIGQNDVDLVEPGTSSNEGDDTSFAQDNMESESVSEIESDVEKKKVTPHATTQTASAKEVSYEDGDDDSPIDSEAEKKIVGSEEVTSHMYSSEVTCNKYSSEVTINRKVAKLTYWLEGEYLIFKKSDFTLLTSLSIAYPPEEYFEMDELDPSEFRQKYFPCLEKMRKTFKGAVKL
ncbi:hypothetical protein IFM89_027107 [Coptis chinensis]|uniref:Uncharacterized protein n=1 Tax=Coptis chinensis TaxID=261450 RepID=A0A835H6B6_9MAGN|nr:hypothetical protein IFM89_027107 [Coptis chinensis]